MNSFVTISDVHIRGPGGKEEKLFLKFLAHPKTQSATDIYLLGDIFDLICGDHTAYLEKYENVFNALDKLLKSGKNIFYIEGNHDVHVGKLFGRRFNGALKVYKEGFSKKYGDKSFYFGHGDEIDYTDKTYLRYKKFINTKPLEFFANNLLPFKVLESVGNWASKKSKKVGSRKFDFEKEKKRIRQLLFDQVDSYNYDCLFLGHTHIADDYKINSRVRYVNNGYFPMNKQFIHYKEKIYFVDVSK